MPGSCPGCREHSGLVTGRLVQSEVRVMFADVYSMPIYESQHFYNVDFF